MKRTQEEWIGEYRRLMALWMHNGDLGQAHVQLTSGLHSNGFFNSRLVIGQDDLLNEAASYLLQLLLQCGTRVETVIRVVAGPQTGATRLAQLIADQVPTYSNRVCAWVSPAKHESDGKKSMVLSEEERSRVTGELTLLCEDVCTTAGSIELAAAAVNEAGGLILPYVLVLVNRSGLTHANGRKIVALIDYPMQTWKAEDCPLCKGGSKALHPPKDHWAELNATR